MTDELEPRLIQGYQTQATLYDRALHVADSAANFAELNAILREISAVEAVLAEDKAAWRSSGRQPGPLLREALDSVTERIRALAALVDQLVADLEARKQALLPGVDECIQQRRMLHAYAKSK